MYRIVTGQEPRQSTSNVGHLTKPSIQVGRLSQAMLISLIVLLQALIHGLNRHYYSIAINFRKTELEQSMLLNLHKQNWTDGLRLTDFEEHKKCNEDSMTVNLAFA